MNLRRVFTGILIVLLSLFMVLPAFAHGDEPRLEISVERVNPGGVIEVRGVDFEMDELVNLELVGPDTSIPLGEFVADVEGVFSYIITIPVDLKEGAYTFRATTDDHVIESPSFEVWGMAIAENEDGQRTEEDPLLAAMPTYAPGVSVTPMPVVEEVATPIASPAPSFPWVLVSAGVGVVVVLFLVILLRRRRG